MFGPDSRSPFLDFPPSFFLGFPYSFRGAFPLFFFLSFHLPSLWQLNFVSKFDDFLLKFIDSGRHIGF